MTRDLTRGDFRGHLWALAPAAIAGMALLVAFEMVDVFWVGRMPGAEEALAALTVGTYSLWALYAIGTMVEFGTLAMCSQEVGGRRHDAARRNALRGILVAVFFWLLTGLAAPFVVPWAVKLSAVGPEIAGPAERYLDILFWGALPIYGFGAVNAIFRSHGDTRTPMWLLLAGLVLNAAIDPLVVLGRAGFPALGLEGAAWVSVGTRSVSLIGGVYILARRGWLARPGRFLIDRFASYSKIVRIGVPIGVGGVLYSATFIWLARILAEGPADAIAAYGVGQKIEALSWASIYGIGTVAGAWVGQNLGAGKPARATRGAWWIAAVAATLGTLAALVYVVFADELVGLFAPGQEGVLRYARIYLWIIAASQAFFALEIILQEALAGAGDTVPPTVIVVLVTCLRIPAAYVFADGLDWGPAGVFAAVSASTAVKGILIALWFRRGSWIARGLKITGEGQITLAALHAPASLLPNQDEG